MNYFRLTCVAAAAAMLVACGGSDDPDRGELVDPAVVVTTLTAPQIDAATASSGLQALVGKATCDVKVVALNYATPGARAGEISNASGVMLVPAGACTGPTPLVAHARGTDVLKTRTLANPQDPETFLLAAMFAAHGYAVVATDYLGYAKSSYGFHPYLHADSEATTVIDSVRAARNAAGTVAANLSGKVMFTGYSQGGHASMAAQRAAERDYGNEFNVAAGAHLAGPYNLSGSLRSPQPAAVAQLFAPYMLTSFQKVYGNVYTDVKTVFKAPYAGYIETLMPNATMGNTALLASGLLPGGTTSAALDALFQPGYLDSVRTIDSQPFYVAAKKNDLLGWTPKAKVLLCGGSGDPTVPPALHQAVMKADFDRRGVSNVVSVDVDPYVQAAYGINGVAPTDPTSAAFATYYGSYHGVYEPPLCLAQAKGWFDTVK
ncbi:lipase family protein [Acidovorax sp. FHTAMBA]|jgi:pimeloyl-ACP methyl ester carboxylesterase|uniref:alpha/beta hydrolase n=1 Tax=Acidovorax sp. FHTAMBA TaxID=3140252 RepID=UPI003182FFDB